MTKSTKSTIKEKLLYDSIRRQQALPCLGDADRVRLRESVNSRPTHKAQAQPTDKTKDMLSIPSAHLPNPRPRHPLSSGRADNACTNLLGYLVRCVRTRGIDEAVGSDKTADFTFALCRTHLPRTARATNSCTPHGGSEGGRRESSLLTFGTFRH